MEGGTGGALQPAGAAGAPPSLAATLALMATLSGGNAVLVSRRQVGNPVLRHLRCVRWSFADGLVPDYVLGVGVVALFLSLKFALLHPTYLNARIRELGRAFRLRVVLCHVDVDDPAAPLEAANLASLHGGCTLLCATCPEECARVLETLRLYERKTAESITARPESDYASRFASCLTALKGVNRTDCATLGARLGSLAAVLTATEARLRACPGLGPAKVRRLHGTFNTAHGRGGAAAAAQQPQQPQPQQQPQQQQQQQQQRQAPPPAAAAEPAAGDEAWDGDEEGREGGDGGGDDGGGDDGGGGGGGGGAAAGAPAAGDDGPPDWEGGGGGDDDGEEDEGYYGGGGAAGSDGDFGG